VRALDVSLLLLLAVFKRASCVGRAFAGIHPARDSLILQTDRADVILARYLQLTDEAVVAKPARPDVASYYIDQVSRRIDERLQPYFDGLVRASNLVRYAIARHQITCIPSCTVNRSNYTLLCLLYDSTFSRTVWRLYGRAKGLVIGTYRCICRARCGTVY
jgi:hypothetical protein